MKKYVIIALTVLFACACAVSGLAAADEADGSSPEIIINQMINCQNANNWQEYAELMVSLDRQDYIDFFASETNRQQEIIK